MKISLFGLFAVCMHVFTKTKTLSLAEQLRQFSAQESKENERKVEADVRINKSVDEHSRPVEETKDSEATRMLVLKPLQERRERPLEYSQIPQLLYYNKYDIQDLIRQELDGSHDALDIQSSDSEIVRLLKDPFGGSIKQISGIITKCDYAGLYLQDESTGNYPTPLSGIFVMYAHSNAMKEKCREFYSATFRGSSEIQYKEDDLPIPQVVFMAYSINVGEKIVFDPFILNNLKVSSLITGRRFIHLIDDLAKVYRIALTPGYALAQYLSLSNMYVQVRFPYVVGIDKTQRYMTIAVLPDGDQHTQHMNIYKNRVFTNKGVHTRVIHIKIAAREIEFMRLGSILTHVTGILRYQFNQFVVLPIDDESVQLDTYPDYPKPLAIPIDVDNGLRIATYNMKTIGSLEFDEARVKIFARHIAVDLRCPHVVALQEVNLENDILGQLVDAINSIDDSECGHVYTSIIIKAASTDDQFRLVYLYRTDVHTLNFIDGSSRFLDKPYFQRRHHAAVAKFEYSGQAFYVFNVHLTASYDKGPYSIYQYRGKMSVRYEQLKQIRSEICNIQQNEPDTFAFVVGDFNMMESESGMEKLTYQSGYEREDGECALIIVDETPIDDIVEDYTTYNSARAVASKIDHVLVTSNVESLRPDRYTFHANSIFEPPSDGRFNEFTAASDHDPVLLHVPIHSSKRKRKVKSVK